MSARRVGVASRASSARFTRWSVYVWKSVFQSTTVVGLCVEVCVPVYHWPYEEGVLVLLCVVGRQLETASISDFVTIDNVCGLKVLIHGGS